MIKYVLITLLLSSCTTIQLRCVEKEIVVLTGPCLVMNNNQPRCAVMTDKGTKLFSYEPLKVGQLYCTKYIFETK